MCPSMAAWTTMIEMTTPAATVLPEGWLLVMAVAAMAMAVAVAVTVVAAMATGELWRCCGGSGRNLLR